VNVYETVAAAARFATSPTPMPVYEGDTNLVTPGVIGFVITFGVALATVFLLIDMTRRIRRTRYRAEVREQLDAERADSERADSGRAESGRAESGRAETGSVSPPED